MWLVAVILDRVVLVAKWRDFPLLFYIFMSLAFDCRNVVYFVSQTQILLVPLLYIAGSYVVASPVHVENRISKCLYALTTWNSKLPCKSPASLVLTSHR